MKAIQYSGEWILEFTNLVLDVMVHFGTSKELSYLSVLFDGEFFLRNKVVNLCILI